MTTLTITFSEDEGITMMLSLSTAIASVDKAIVSVTDTETLAGLNQRLANLKALQERISNSEWSQ